MADAPRPSWNKRAFGAVRLLLFGACLVIVGDRVRRDAAELPALVGQLRWSWLVAAGLAQAVGLLLLPRLFASTDRALRGDAKGRLREYARIWFTAYLYRYIPGKVMLVVERVRLGERIGLKRATSLALIAWEHVFLLLGAAPWLCIGLLLGADVDGWVVVVPVGAAALTLWLAPVALRAERLQPLWKRVGGEQLTSSTLAFGAQLRLAVGYAGVWGGLSLSFVGCALALGPVATADVALLAFWFVAAYLAGIFAAIAPAGLGVREGVLLLGAATVLPAPQATAAVLLVRLVATATELSLFAAFAPVRLPDPPAPPDSEGA